MNEEKRVTALWDMYAGSHSDIAGRFVAYHAHLRDAGEARAADNLEAAQRYRIRAKQSLGQAIAELREQGARALRFADELETI